MSRIAPYSDETRFERFASMEELYEKFNLFRPADFRGHSLSVSDIVALNRGGAVSFHYVDSIGFQELSGFWKPENYWKNAEMTMEDDYSMLDGIVNNGRRESGPERPSVLEQLKAAREPERKSKPPQRSAEKGLE